MKKLILLFVICFFVIGCALHQGIIKYHDIALQCRSNPEFKLTVPDFIPDVDDYYLRLVRFNREYCFVNFYHPKSPHQVTLVAKCMVCEVAYLVYSRFKDDKEAITKYYIIEDRKGREITETELQAGLEKLKGEVT